MQGRYSIKDKPTNIGACFQYIFACGRTKKVWINNEGKEQPFSLENHICSDCEITSLEIYSTTFHPIKEKVKVEKALVRLYFYNKSWLIDTKEKGSILYRYIENIEDFIGDKEYLDDSYGWNVYFWCYVNNEDELAHQKELLC